MWTHRVIAQAAMCRIHPQSGAMRGQIHDQELETAVNAVAVMEKLKYNVFADSELYASSQPPSPSLPLSTADTRGQLTVTGMTIFPNGPHPMTLIAGWAVDWPNGDLAGGVTVVLDGVQHPARYGLPRRRGRQRARQQQVLERGVLVSGPFRRTWSGPTCDFFEGIDARSLRCFHHAC